MSYAFRSASRLPIRPSGSIPILLVLFGTLLPPGLEAIEPTRATPARPERSFADDRSLINRPREAPDTYVVAGDDFRLEFTRDGWICRFHSGEKYIGFWLMEIRGSDGPIVWSAGRSPVDFDMEEGEVRYRRTRALTEAYSADRYGVRQIWIVDENPLFERGDVTIVGEILTPLDVRLLDGRIQLYDGANRVGGFCSFEARDPSGRILDLTPELDGRLVRLTLPGNWLHGVGSGDLSRR